MAQIFCLFFRLSVHPSLSTEGPWENHSEAHVASPKSACPVGTFDSCPGCSICGRGASFLECGLRMARCPCVCQNLSEIIMSTSKLFQSVYDALRVGRKGNKDSCPPWIEYYGMNYIPSSSSYVEILTSGTSECDYWEVGSLKRLLSLNEVNRVVPDWIWLVTL